MIEGHPVLLPSAREACGKARSPLVLVIFLMQKLRPRPLGNFPQFP